MVKGIVLSRGAEAILYMNEEGNLLKKRVEKGYRIPQLDERLRKRRTRSEASLLREARRAGVATPQIKFLGEDIIEMEFIEGHMVKALLDEENYEEISQKIGVMVAKLHKSDIIHGDLTTSNMLVKNGELFLVDFGLGFQSSKAEDKAVDLYLLYHALESTHWTVFKKAWKIILKEYSKNYGEAGKVIKTLSDIKKRGRYKERSQK
jgi:Kae1-associated kinase Bud32